MPSLPNNSIVNVNVCLLNVIFCMYVHTPMSQPGMDTTNFARLTTDVSIYFGSTSVLCNNTISCLLICDIIFQPCVFPIRAPVPFGSFSITLASPATGGMLCKPTGSLQDLHQQKPERAGEIQHCQLKGGQLRWAGIRSVWGPSWAMPTQMVIQ